MDKTFEITIRIKVKDNHDLDQVVGEMDYMFSHDGIVDTEIVSGPDNIKDAS